jgi:hypothetical protein
MTPAAESHELVEIEVRPALRALHDVVHVEPSADTARLAAPTGSGQDLLPDRSPFGPTGRSTTLRPRASRAHAPARPQAEQRTPAQHGAAARFCPRGQKSGTPSTGSLSRRS